MLVDLLQLNKIELLEHHHSDFAQTRPVIRLHVSRAKRQVLRSTLATAPGSKLAEILSEAITLDTDRPVVVDLPLKVLQARVDVLCS